MSGNTPPILQAFNRWILTVLETLDTKMDIGTPVETADRLTTAFGVELTGDATASGTTDGSTTLNLGIVLAASGIGAGEYAVLTVDAKGRATSGRALGAADIPSLDAAKVTSGVFAAARIPTLNQSTSGNAATATKWQTARNVSMSGDGTWTVTVDGTANATAALTLSNSGVTPGVYPKVTVDAKGRVTGGAALDASDIPTLNQNTTGSAATLTTSRNISMTGDGTWTVPFNGGANATAVFTLANSGVSAGTYPKVTVDAKGRVTGGAALGAADIPDLDTSKMTTGTLQIARGGTGGNTQATARTALGIGSMAIRDVTISTAAPSGGVDGQIWLQY